MTAPLHIVYRAYGASSFLDQTLYSILSLRHVTPDGDAAPRVVVYTDQPGYFESSGLDIICCPLSRERMRAWSGRYGFVHRLKLELLKDAVANYGAPLLYVDGDTIWTASPQGLTQALMEGRFLMHKFEGEVSPQFYPALYECLRHELPRLRHEMQVADSSVIPMWNSGVVGLPHAATDLIGRSLRLCDALFTRSYQREWLEQLALSLVLQDQTIATCEHAIAHYWGYADEATPIIRGLLEAGTTEGIRRFVPIDPAELEARSRAVQRSPSNRRRQALKRLRRSYHKRLQHLRVAVDLRLGRA